MACRRRGRKSRAFAGPLLLSWDSGRTARSSRPSAPWSPCRRSGSGGEACWTLRLRGKPWHAEVVEACRGPVVGRRNHFGSNRAEVPRSPRPSTHCSRRRSSRASIRPNTYAKPPSPTDVVTCFFLPRSACVNAAIRQLPKGRTNASLACATRKNLWHWARHVDAGCWCLASRRDQRDRLSTTATTRDGNCGQRISRESSRGRDPMVTILRRQAD